MLASSSTLRRLLLLGTALAAGAAAAQGVYRHVGPDGRVTFSDQPPAGASAPALATASAPSGNGSQASSLPFGLRQVAQRYPVTLYTGKDCAACDQGRQLLQSRGVPFTEKTVNTAADAQAFQRIAGSAGIPYLMLGTQAIAGFSAPEWTQYLDAAGYPKQSQLPRTYVAPAPAPLVPLPAQPAASHAPEAPAVAEPRPAPPPALPPTGPSPSNPAGIRF